MTGSDLRRSLEGLAARLGLDPSRQADRAAVVGYKRQTSISAYESGVRPVPSMLALAVRALERLNDDQLREVLGAAAHLQ